MIRMIQSRNASHAKAYFRDALAQADYYISGQELAGCWQGRLAERLGLAGESGKEEFSALCENRHPTTGARLTPRQKKDRTVGYDINFHCPKSLSILHAFSQDDHLLTAFRASVRETMQMIEADSRTAVRVSGRAEERKTGELAWAEFIHQTARPVEGHMPDPHLHAHCFVFNATWDPVEERIKAGQFREINRDMPYYQACFQKTLADKLAELGYQIRRTETSFEIAGVPERVIDLFSKRTDEIGRTATAQGITDAKARSELGARTRAKKQKGASMAELTRDWRQQIDALGPASETEAQAIIRFAPPKAPAIDPPEVATRPDAGDRRQGGAAQIPGFGPGREATTAPTLVQDASGLTARHCVDYALLHCFERASVIDGRRLLETALHRSLGASSVPALEIHRAFQADPRVLHVQEKGRTLCTTKEVLAEERRMVALARSGQNQMRPLYTAVPDIALTDERQRRAVSHVLTTPHRVSIIRGVAGSGKTTLMREAVGHIEQAGTTVVTVAPTARASRGALREAGFGTATTVAHLLADTGMQAALKGQVLWVDEAGLLGTKDMAALLDLTARQNARLILSGDTRQHASVARGDALRILNTVAGIQTAEVSKIYRQTTRPYREAVKDLSEGQVARAFGTLDAMGCIQDVSERSLVKDYLAALKQGRSALVISPTHAQGETITAEIRAELRQQGMLGKKEIKAVHLKPLNLTEAEKSDPRRFVPGQIVQFTQNVPGIRRGSQWTVVQATAGEVRIAGIDGRTRMLPTDQSGRYEVFETGTIALAKGDKIRITKNGFDAERKRLNNGDLLTVLSVSKRGTIVLQNDIGRGIYTIGASFGHLAHAHCITSYAAQGKNVDEVFLYQPASSFPATDAKQFYVSVSRARVRAHIYTDDREALLHHAMNPRERQSALELTGPEHLKNQRHTDAIARQRQSEAERGHTRRPQTREDYELEL